jgi:hypothetical protein
VNIDHLQYVVSQSYYQGGDALIPHLIVNRRDGAGGTTWDELQAVKNIAFGPDVTCIEVYPPQHEVVNEMNIRHLWVLP